MGKGKHDQIIHSHELENTKDGGQYQPCVIVHGGAWSVLAPLIPTTEEGVQLAAKAGYTALLKGGSALDAVEAAVRNLEDNPVFNAGYGSVLTSEGNVEMDAMIMDGSTLNTGAVACVRGITNPVSLARRVMTDTSHCLLVADGAVKFAQDINMPMVEPESLISEYSKFKSTLGSDDVDFEEALRRTMNTGGKDFKMDQKAVEELLSKELKLHDTVGAVAMDQHGNIASATSTGGLIKKMPGRVGDSPMVGSGGYANNMGGASTTGHGESILKIVLARDVIYQLENGREASEACTTSINKMFDLTKGQGGVICIDKHGNYSKAFSTHCMSWAAIKGDILEYGILPGQETKVDLRSEVSK